MFLFIQVHKLGFEEAANQNGEIRFLVDENTEIQETPMLRGSTCFLEWERRFGFRTNIGFTRSFHMVAADINVNEANGFQCSYSYFSCFRFC
jgi:hypothetical protein